jgi:signal transduction histidine kinase
MSSQVAKLSPMFIRLTVNSGRGEAKLHILVDMPLRALRMIRGSLRAKFILVIVALQVAVMGAVTVIMERHQRQAIIEQARLRALSIATSLAAGSEGSLLSYDFIKLEQAAEKVTADNMDVIYAVAHLYDGRVAVFTGRDDLQGRTLSDPISQGALQVTKPLVQEIILPETERPGYDVAIPVFIPRGSKKWGTIRVGFSLERAYDLIHRTRRDLLLLSLAAIFGGTSLAIFLAMRISRPIGQLVTGVHAFGQGSYDRSIQVDTEDEIGYLAHAFEEMRTALQRHLASLTDEKRRLEEAYCRLQDTQQQLIQSESMAAVGKVAARVAHEVNNPLAIIKTAVRIIRNQSAPDSPTTGSLQMIEDEISRISRIIQELLEFSRPPTLVQERVQVNNIVQGLALLLEHDLREKRIALKIILEPELPLVLISADQLKQVVLNIVRNAQDAMPQGGDLVIRTARQGQRVELSIADTGYGIPAEHRERIFDPFFTTKRRGKGAGLGLAVSYSIITGATGHINVESEVGKGSLFRVSLPGVQAVGGG